MQASDRRRSPAAAERDRHRRSRPIGAAPCDGNAAGAPPIAADGAAPLTGGNGEACRGRGALARQWRRKRALRERRGLRKHTTAARNGTITTADNQRRFSGQHGIDRRRRSPGGATTHASEVRHFTIPLRR